VQHLFERILTQAVGLVVFAGKGLFSGLSPNRKAQTWRNPTRYITGDTNLNSGALPTQSANGAHNPSLGQRPRKKRDNK
jgi:hypothetical protein